MRLLFILLVCLISGCGTKSNMQPYNPTEEEMNKAVDTIINSTREADNGILTFNK